MTDYSFLDEYGPESIHERRAGKPDRRGDAMLPRPLIDRHRIVGVGVGNLRGAVGMRAMMAAGDRVPGGVTQQSAEAEVQTSPDEVVQLTGTPTVEDSVQRVREAFEKREQDNA